MPYIRGKTTTFKKYSGSGIKTKTPSLTGHSPNVYTNRCKNLVYVALTPFGPLRNEARVDLTTRI